MCEDAGVLAWARREAFAARREDKSGTRRIVLFVTFDNFTHSFRSGQVLQVRPVQPGRIGYCTVRQLPAEHVDPTCQRRVFGNG